MRTLKEGDVYVDRNGALGFWVDEITVKVSRVAGAVVKVTYTKQVGPTRESGITSAEKIEKMLREDGYTLYTRLKRRR
ncbi:MAG: hypothetical protein ACTSPB_23665 [Candidatus Thorarchaeota archaeon]